MEIKYHPFDKNQDYIIPVYATEHSAGLDLSSSSKEIISIIPGEYKIIPTNLVAEIPEGYEAQIRPRSGLALKFGITVLNSPGTIDADYRGEIKVLLINHGKKEFKVNFGDRIAQMIISPYKKVNFVLSENISATDRGTGGYGSTGK
ncbi:MAG: dUTP diphosphatase [Ignavibacteria bacterium]|nr:dUTP diphosphatase [Ignavibacteria bacterium]